MSLLYHLHVVPSRHKCFTSCGTSGKLTLWTPLLKFRINRFIGAEIVGGTTFYTQTHTHARARRGTSDKHFSCE